MTSINTSSTIDNKNNSIIKKTKHFFTKKKLKHSDNQTLESNTSFLNNKEDSNKTLILNNENNEGDSTSLKQNKPVSINKKNFVDEKSTLNKSENMIEKNGNLEFLQKTINDLDKKIDDISNSFKLKSNEWQTNHTEISERLNCLMWQMNQFQKEQIELSKKMNKEINSVQTSLSNEIHNTSNFKNNIDKMKENVGNFQISLTNEIQNTLNLKEDIYEMKKNTQKINDNINIYESKTNENILQQKSELNSINSKFENIQLEFNKLKEKVELLSDPPIEKSKPKKFNLNDFDDSLIEFITKCVKEKIEQQNELNESLLKQQDQTSNTDFNAKIIELNEKLDEFQIYQLSREVELQRMKIKLEDTVNLINKQFNTTNDKNINELIKKSENENNKIRSIQNKINSAVYDLEVAIDEIKIDFNKSLNEQQNKIDYLSKSTELLKQKNETEIEINERSINDKKIDNDLTSTDITEQFEKIKININSLTDDINMLNMETKLTTTNISLIWDDVRTMKNFIDHYEMNDKLKETEIREEIKEIYNQIDNLKNKNN